MVLLSLKTKGELLFFRGKGVVPGCQMKSLLYLNYKTQCGDKKPNLQTEEPTHNEQDRPKREAEYLRVLV